MNDALHVGEWFFREIDEFENAPHDCRQTADGCALDAYLCPSDQWTIGDGCCFWEDGRPVKKGDTLPDDETLPERRRKLLAFNAKYCEEYVRRHVTVPLNQNQFDVLCSFRFNTRETTLSGSSRLLPAINAQKWQDAAIAMTEFVYGSGSKRGPATLPPKGWDVAKIGGEWWAIPPEHMTGAERVSLGPEEKTYPYQDAHRGLLRRRLWGALVFLGYDPRDVTKDNDVALPTKAKLLSSGVWRDKISEEGLTTLAHVRARASLLPPSELVLSTPIKAEPVSVPAGTAGQPERPPQPSAPAVPAQKPAAASPAAASAASPGVSQGSPPPVVNVPAKVAPPPLPKDAAPASIEPKDMILSKRFWGLTVTALGTTNLLPQAAQTWISNEGNRELITWLVVVLIGFALYKYGQHKARKPLK
jgi:lysozyme